MEELTRLNPWWKNKHAMEDDFHLTKVKYAAINWHPRLIPKLSEGIYSIRGPRQIGKTTWIKQTIKELLQSVSPENIMFFNCDLLHSNEDIVKTIRTYVELLHPAGIKYIFLDEVSYVSEWQLGVKHLYDSGELKDTVLVITGSYSIDIKKAFEKLPGRLGGGKRHYKLLPLTFREYLSTIDSPLLGKKNLKLYLEELNQEFKSYLLTGGFPAVIDCYKKNGFIDESLYETYKNWIIGDLEKWGKSEKNSKQLFKRIFETYTSEINWDTLSGGTEIKSHTTVKEYVSSFEDIFAVEFVHKMDYNKKIPDYPKSKKIYFGDPFIYYSVWKWCFGEEKCFNLFKEQLQNNLFVSKIVEGTVLNHLTKHLEQKSSLDRFDYKDTVFYWRNRTNSVEIDFVLKQGLQAFEVKWSEQVKSNNFGGKKYFNNLLLLTKNLEGKGTEPVSLFLAKIM